MEQFRVCVEAVDGLAMALIVARLDAIFLVITARSVRMSSSPPVSFEPQANIDRMLRLISRTDADWYGLRSATFLSSA